MKNKKSFAAPSAKPVDVEYRIKRLRETLADAEMFLNAIDPVVFPELHAKVRSTLIDTMASAGELKAPAKKPRRTAEEKAQEAAAKALAKEEASKAKASKAKAVKEAA